MLQAEMIEWNQVADTLRESAAKLKQAQRIGKIGYWERVLLQAADAARLLGAEPILVGIRPELAQTIVGLGLDLSSLKTQADLQSSIRYAAQRQVILATH